MDEYPHDPLPSEVLKHDIREKVDRMNPSSLGQRVAMEESMYTNYLNNTGDPDADGPSNYLKWKEQFGEEDQQRQDPEPRQDGEGQQRVAEDR